MRIVQDSYNWSIISNPLYYAGKLYLNGKLLTDLVIPDSVTSIDEYIFLGGHSLTNVTIPDSVKSIGMYAFMGCTNLASITIPDSVTSIREGAFVRCGNLRTVYYIGTAEDWSNININSYNNANTSLTSATRYYYSETQPTDTTYEYWHYVDGVPTKW
ncbi:MAG: leucine-rich repeat domain-containing protein [Ruminococcaceae bacterium]|nr:leucine-rich repeat domain-containing protein [Oscillospiraceae bacterium]